MRNTPALSRLVAPMIAVGILVAGCGHAPTTQPPTYGAAAPANRSLRRDRSPCRRGARRAMAAAANGNRNWLRRRPGGSRRAASTGIPPAAATRWSWRTSPGQPC